MRKSDTMDAFRVLRVFARASRQRTLTVRAIATSAALWIDGDGRDLDIARTKHLLRILISAEYIKRRFLGWELTEEGEDACRFSRVSPVLPTTAWIEEARSGIRTSGKRSEIKNAVVPTREIRNVNPRDMPRGIAVVSADIALVVEKFGVSYQDASDGLRMGRYIVCQGYKVPPHASRYDGHHRICSSCRNRRARERMKNHDK